MARPLSSQFARFVIVGASNTALTLGCYALLLAGGLHYLAALVPAFLVGALNGYTLNRVWTFRAGPFRGEALARYVATQLTALGLNALALTTFVELLGVTRLPGQLLAMPIVSCVTFAANRGWVFRRSVAHSCREDHSTAARITEVRPTTRPTIQPATPCPPSTAPSSTAMPMMPPVARTRIDTRSTLERLR